jgi:hypothetical protein
LRISVDEAYEFPPVKSTGNERKSGEEKLGPNGLARKGRREKFPPATDIFIWLCLSTSFPRRYRCLTAWSSLRIADFGLRIASAEPLGEANPQSAIRNPQ